MLREARGARRSRERFREKPAEMLCEAGKGSGEARIRRREREKLGEVLDTVSRERCRGRRQER